MRTRVRHDLIVPHHDVHWSLKTPAGLVWVRVRVRDLGCVWVSVKKGARQKRELPGGQLCVMFWVWVRLGLGARPGNVTSCEGTPFL